MSGRVYNVADERPLCRRRSSRCKNDCDGDDCQDWIR